MKVFSLFVLEDELCEDDTRVDLTNRITKKQERRGSNQFLLHHNKRNTRKNPNNYNNNDDNDGDDDDYIYPDTPFPKQLMARHVHWSSQKCISE